MLAFITSLRHPMNSHDYLRVEDIFFESVESWVRQTDPRFLVIAVGNRKPSRPLPDGVRFVEVDFDPPTSRRGPMTGIPAVLKDKGTKLAVGLLAAREHPDLSHVMFTDADDFVSMRLAGFVARHQDKLGWTIMDGWRYHRGRRSVRPHRGDFHLQCGSSHIVRHDVYPAVDLPPSATQEELYAAFGDRLERWIGSHMFIEADIGLEPLPFPGALYGVGTGEAHSGNGMGSFGRPLSAALADEFGVEATGRSPQRIARAILPGWSALINRLPGSLTPGGR